MKDEAVHYFNLAISRIVHHAKNQEALKLEEGISAQEKYDMTFFLLELLKEQVPHEDTNSSAR